MLNRMKKIVDSKYFMTFLGLFGLFLVSVGISLAVFTFLVKDNSQLSVSGNKDVKKVSRVDLSKPKTEACPINGEMFTKAQKDLWSTKRPIVAAIENHLDSRPQSGLSVADVIYEAVAEGGITRFLAVFYCRIADNNYTIGQIRSARVYFINYALEYGDKPLFVHWGGANNICNNCPGGIKPKGDIDPRVDAYKQLEKIGWVNGRYGNDMNGATNTGYPALYTDDRRMNLASEHQKVGSTDKIYEEASRRGFEYENSDGVNWDKNFREWKFTDTKPENPSVTEISFDFWDSMAGYDVVWKYDHSKNSYLRFNGGKEHVDLENNEQISAKSIAIIKVKEEGPVDKEHHMFYTVIGSGDANVFQNGTVINGTWEKKSQTDRIVFFDESGEEIEFARGQIWIEVLPIGNDVNFK